MSPAVACAIALISAEALQPTVAWVVATAGAAGKPVTARAVIAAATSY
ncbi:hypothetical protein [Streptomyces achromogenes]